MVKGITVKIKINNRKFKKGEFLFTYTINLFLQSEWFDYKVLNSRKAIFETDMLCCVGTR